MRTEEELMHGLWNEQEATLAANASRLKKKRVAIVAAVIVVAVAALFITMRAFAAGPTQVSTWAQFQQAYQNTDVSSIQLTANITRGTSDSVLSNGGFELNRSLEISGDNGQGGNYTLNFGADATNTNAFDLGQATAGTGNVLNIHNLTIVHAGADYNDCVIYSSDNTNNSAGWTVKFADVNNGSSPSGAALVNCQDAPGDWMVSDGTPEGNGVNVELSGNVTWKTTNNYCTFSAGPVTIDDNAAVDIETTSANDNNGSCINSNGAVNIGKGVSLTLKDNTTATGGTAFVALYCTSLNVAAQDSAPSSPNINITTACGSAIRTAGDLTIGANNNVLINDTNPAEYDSYAAVMVAPDETPAQDATLEVDSGATMTVNSGAYNGVNINTCSADPGDNSAGAGGNGTLHINGGTLTINVNQSGDAGITNEHCALYVESSATQDAPGGGTLVTNGGKLNVSNSATASGSTLVRERLGYGQFITDGAGSEVNFNQGSSGSGYNAVIHFVYGTTVQMVTRNGGSVYINRPVYTSGSGIPAIRFGSSQNDGFICESGGQVYIHNGGNPNYNGGATPASAYGNECVEFFEDGDTFEVTGQGSACTLISDNGPAIYAHDSADDSTIDVGEGCSFEASGNDPYAVFNAGGSGFTFNSYKPLYYDFKNTKSGGGPIMRTGNNCVFTACDSDLSIWRAGVNNINGNADKDFTDISYQLTGNLDGTSTITQSSFTNPLDPNSTTYPSSDSGYVSYYNQYNMSKYTRISGNNASPAITDPITATNADYYVRFPANVPEGVSQTGRAAMDGEVLGDYSYNNAENAAPNGTTYNYTWEDQDYTGVYYAPSINADTYMPYGSTGTTGSTTMGDIRISPTGGTAGTTYLTAGDTYTLNQAWRDAATPTATGVKPADLTGLGGATVYDVLPPQPATINTLYANQTTVTGTWAYDGIKDSGDKPAAIYYQITKSGSSTPGTLTLASDATIGDVDTTTNTGDWSFTLPSNLSTGDKLQVFFADDGTDVASNADSSIDPISGLQVEVDSTGAIVANGTVGGKYVNLEPATATVYHDTTIPAAGSTTVQKAIYEIDATSTIIGMDQATGTGSDWSTQGDDISNSFIAGILNASAYNIENGTVASGSATEIPLYVKSISPTFDSSATVGKNYTITLEAGTAASGTTPANYITEKYFIFVDPNGNVVMGKNGYLSYQDVSTTRATLNNYTTDATLGTYLKTTSSAQAYGYTYSSTTGYSTTEGSTTYVANSQTATTSTSSATFGFNGKTASGVTIVNMAGTATLEADPSVSIDEPPTVSPTLINLDDTATASTIESDITSDVTISDDVDTSTAAVTALDNSLKISDTKLGVSNKSLSDYATALAADLHDGDVHSVTYTVTDSAGNTTSATGIIGVNITPIGDYLVASNDFTIRVGNVDVSSTANTQAQVLSEGNAGIYYATAGTGHAAGDAVASSLITYNLGGYTNTVGSYTYSLTLTSDSSVTTSSTATVASYLTVTKDVATGQATTVNPGDSIKWTITVKNDSPNAMTNVEVSDSLNASGNTNTSGKFSGPSAGTVNSSGTEVTIASLAAGSSATMTYTYTPDSSDLGKTIVNTANAVDSEGDSGSDDSATSVRVNGSVTLSNSVTSINGETPTSGQSVNPGDVVVYSIAVTNTGGVNSAPVTGVVLSDNRTGTWSNPTTSGTYSGSVGNITSNASDNTETIASMPAGSTVTFTYTYTVASADIDSNGNLVNTASLTDDQGDTATKDATIGYVSYDITATNAVIGLSQASDSSALGWTAVSNYKGLATLLQATATSSASTATSTPDVTAVSPAFNANDSAFTGTNPQGKTYAVTLATGSNDSYTETYYIHVDPEDYVVQCDGGYLAYNPVSTTRTTLNSYTTDSTLGSYLMTASNAKAYSTTWTDTNNDGIGDEYSSSPITAQYVANSASVAVGTTNKTFEFKGVDGGVYLQTTTTPQAVAVAEPPVTVDEMPSITITTDPVVVQVGDSATTVAADINAAVTASDAEDSSVTLKANGDTVADYASSIVTAGLTEGNVYAVTYTVTDSAGNTTTEYGSITVGQVQKIGDYYVYAGDFTIRDGNVHAFPTTTDFTSTSYGNAHINYADNNIPGHHAGDQVDMSLVDFASPATSGAAAYSATPGTYGYSITLHSDSSVTASATANVITNLGVTKIIPGATSGQPYTVSADATTGVFPTIAWTVSVTNNDSVAVSNVVVTDSHAGTFSNPKVDGVTGGTVGNAGSTVTFTSLAANSTATMTFSYTPTSSDVGTTITNTATAVDDQGDSTTATSNVDARINGSVTIAKSITSIGGTTYTSGMAAQPGQPIVYKVLVTNNGITGSDPVTNVIVSDDMVNSSNPSGDGWGSTHPTTGTVGTITANAANNTETIASMSAGSSVQFSYTYTVPNDTTGSVTNTASLTDDQGDTASSSASTGSVQYNITATNAVIGLDKATDGTIGWTSSTTPADNYKGIVNLLAASATANNGVTTTSTAVDVVSISPAFDANDPDFTGDNAPGKDYTVTLGCGNNDSYTQDAYIHVDPGNNIIQGKDGYLKYNNDVTTSRTAVNAQYTSESALGSWLVTQAGAEAYTDSWDNQGHFSSTQITAEYVPGSGAVTIGTPGSTPATFSFRGVKSDGTYLQNTSTPSATLTGSPTATVDEFPTISGIVTPQSITYTKNMTFDPMNGVTIADSEDNASTTDNKVLQYTVSMDGTQIGTTNASGSYSGRTPTIASASVHVFTYTATDSAGNVTTVTRVVVFNDGTFTIGTKYIVQASSFVLTRKDAKNETSADLVGGDNLTGAHAWNSSNGQTLTAHVTVNTNNFYNDNAFSSLEDANGVATYPIEVRPNVTDDTGTGANYTQAVRAVTGKVVDRDKVVVTDNYTLAADNIQMNTTEAAGVTNATLISKANAIAFKNNDNLDTTPVEVTSYFQGMVESQRSGVAANQPNGVTFQATDGTSTDSIQRDVSITDGTPPTVNVSTPLVVAKGTGTIQVAPTGFTQGGTFTSTDANMRKGVSVTDREDPTTYNMTQAQMNALITYSVTGPTGANTQSGTAVDLNTAGVYTITYSYTDQDFQTDTATRIVVVNDGNYVVDSNYLIHADNFVALAKDVDTTNLDADAINKAGATAQKFTDDGSGDVTLTDASDDLTVTYGNPAYTNAAGTYGITFSLSDDTTLTKGITAKVVDGDIIVVDGDYVITARNLTGDNSVRGSVVSAAYAAAGNSWSFTSGANWFNVQAYNVNDLSTALGVTLDAANSNLSATPSTTAYHAMFYITSHSSTALNPAAQMLVTNGNAPHITVSGNPMEIAMGSTTGYTPWNSDIAYWDTTDGTQGGTVETPAATLKQNGSYVVTKDDGTAAANNAVDVNNDGVYTVTYTVVDSDGNSASAAQVVVVNDGSYVITDDYILEAKSFVAQATDVANASNTNDFILQQSGAVAWDATTGEQLDSDNGPYVSNAMGFSSDPKKYEGIEIAIQGHSNVTATIDALVVNSTVTPPDPSTPGYGCYIVGQAISMFSDDEKAMLTNAGGDANEAMQGFIDLGGVAAYEDNASLTTVGVKTTAYTGNFTGVPAGQTSVQHTATFTTQASSPVTNNSMDLAVTVLNNQKPQVDVSPTTVYLLDAQGNGNAGATEYASAWDDMSGVSATDYEDGQTGYNTQTAISASNFTSSATDGVYYITYYATDQQGQQSTPVTRTVVVGPIVVGNTYYIQANNFQVDSDDIAAATDGGNALILSGAQPRAWLIANPAAAPLTNATAGAFTVTNKTGFTALTDDQAYKQTNVSIEVTTDPTAVTSPLATITRNIINDGTYAITADVNKTIDPQTAASDYDNASDIIDAMHVAAFYTGDGSWTPIASSGITVDGSVSATASSTPYTVKFSVAADTRPAYTQGAAAGTYKLVVSRDITVAGGNPPVINGTSVADVTMGATFDPWSGVNITDQEDDASATDTKVLQKYWIEYNGTEYDPSQLGTSTTSGTTGMSGASPIDTSVAGVYTITYKATDSDGNTSTQVRVVVVNDGTYVVGYKYILKAQSFGLTKTEADSNNYGSGDIVSGANLSGAEAWSAIDASSATPVVTTSGNPQGFFSDNTFNNIVDANGLASYNITIGVSGDETTPAATQAVKTIQGQVFNRQIVVNKPDYIIAADPVRLNPTDENGITDATLLSDANAAAYDRNAAGTPLIANGVKLAPITNASGQVLDADGYTGQRNGTTGNYQMNVAVNATGATASDSELVGVTVTTGTPPVVQIDDSPVMVQEGTGKIENGDGTIVSGGGTWTNGYSVSVWDKEDSAYMQDGTTTNPDSVYHLSEDTMKAAITSTGSVDLNTPGVYKVTYSYTDQDFQSDSKTQVVVVNDGTFSVGSSTILRAWDFVVNSSDVDTSTSAVLGLADAQAWDINGDTSTDISNRLGVQYGNPGYSSTAGVYPITITISGDTETKGIHGKVIGDGVIIKTTPDYIITAVSPVVKKTTDMDAYVDDHSVLLGSDWADVHAYDRHDVTGTELGTSLGTTTIPVSGGAVAAGNYTANYYITGHQADTTITGNVNVSVGDAPTITATSQIQVPMNGNAFDMYQALTVNDADNDTGAGVGVENDNVDSTVDTATGKVGDLTITYVVTKDGAAVSGNTVDTNTDGVYKVVYTVTDTEGNQGTATRSVIVNDGSYVVGTNYTLEAKDFVIASPDVQAPLNTLIMNKAGVQVWDKTGAELNAASNAVVSSYGTGATTHSGFSATPDTYSGITIYVTSEPSTTTQIKGQVVGDGIVVPPDPSIPGYGYYLVGNNIKLDVHDYDAIDDIQDLVDLGNVRAISEEDLSSSPAYCTNFTGTLGTTAPQANYTADFAAGSTAPKSSYTMTGLKVQVDDGSNPTIQVPGYLYLPYDSSTNTATWTVGGAAVTTDVTPSTSSADNANYDNWVAGVVASDVDDQAKGEPTGIEVNLLNFDPTTPGIYQIEYRAVDTDYHDSDWVTRLVSVGTQLNVIGHYAIGASDYTVRVGNVDSTTDTNGACAQILSMGSAGIYYADNDVSGHAAGTAVDESNITYNNGGYTNVAGAYTYSLALKDAVVNATNSGQAVSKSATATVASYLTVTKALSDSTNDPYTVSADPTTGAYPAVSWTITVKNDSNAAMTNVAVTDSLAGASNGTFAVAQSALDSITAGEIGTDASGNSVVTIPTLNAGDTATMTFNYTPQASDMGTTISNTVTATDDQGDNTTATSQQDVRVNGSVTIAKSIATVNGTAFVSGQSVQPGDVVAYSIVVSNNSAAGSAAVTNILVSDSLTGSGTNDGWSAGTVGGTGTVGAISSTAGNTKTIASMTAGSTVTFTYTYTVPQGSGSSLSNTASLTDDQGDTSSATVSTDYAAYSITANDKIIGLSDANALDWTGLDQYASIIGELDASATVDTGSGAQSTPVHVTAISPTFSATAVAATTSGIDYNVTLACGPNNIYKQIYCIHVNPENHVVMGDGGYLAYNDISTTRAAIAAADTSSAAGTADANLGAWLVSQADATAYTQQWTVANDGTKTLTSTEIANPGAVYVPNSETVTTSTENGTFQFNGQSGSSYIQDTATPSANAVATPAVTIDEPPTLSVTSPINVAVNASASTVTAALNNAITATDDSGVAPTITVGGSAVATYAATVNTQTEGAVITATFAATDAQGQATTQTALITVGNVVQIGNYLGNASSFSVTIGKVATGNDAAKWAQVQTLGNADIYYASDVTDSTGAVIHHAGDAVDASLILHDIGNYSSTPGSYNYTIGLDADGDGIVDADATTGSAIQWSGTATVTTNLKVTKTLKQGQATVVNPGDPVSWTITVTNTDATDALSNVTVNDSLNADDGSQALLPVSGGKFTQADAGATISTSGTQVDIASLAAGSTLSMTYSYTVPTGTSQTGVNYSNTATASDPAGDWDSATADSTTGNGVHVNGALTASKTVTDASNAYPGGYVVFTVTATNASNYDMTDATVYETMAGTFQDATQQGTASTYVPDGATTSLPCYDFGTLASGDTASVDFKVSIPDTTMPGTAINNSATVKDHEGDVAGPVSPEPGTEPVIQPEPGAMHMTKTYDASQSNPVPGGQVVYAIAVNNTAHYIMNDVTITEQYLGTWANNNGGSAATPGTIVNSSGQQVSTFDFGTIAANGQASVQFTYQVPLTVLAGTTGSATIDNTVSATDHNTATGSDYNDTTTASDSSATITTAANTLSMTKSVYSAQNAYPGGSVSWLISVTNSASYDMPNVTVTEPTLAGEFSNAMIGSYVDAAGVATPAGPNSTSYDFGTVPAGNTATVVFTYNVPTTMAPGDSITNTATATNGFGDGPVQATASAASIIASPNAITTSKTVVDDSNARPGGSATWLITVTNNATYAATNVVVYESMAPGSFSANSVAGTAGTDAQTQLPTFTFASIPAGGQAMVDYTFNIPNTEQFRPNTTFSNTVTFTDDQNDAIPSATPSTGPITVEPSTDGSALSAAKIVLDASNAYPGGYIVYQITATNHTNYDMPDATIFEEQQGTFQNWSMGGTSSVDAVTGYNTFDFGTLTAGSSATVQYKVDIPNTTAPGTQLDNSAYAKDGYGDQSPVVHPSNPGDAVVITNPSGIDLTGSKQVADASNAYPGGQVVYELTASNNMGYIMHNVTLHETMSGSFDNSNIPGVADYTTNVNAPTFTIAALNPGETLTVYFTHQIPSSVAVGTELHNTFTVTNQEGDSKGPIAPPSGSDTVTGNTGFSVTITPHAGQSGVVQPGDTLIYDVTVTNTSDADLSGVTLAVATGSNAINGHWNLSGASAMLGTDGNGNPTATLTFPLAAHSSQTLQTFEMTVSPNATNGEVIPTSVTASADGIQQPATASEQAVVNVPTVPVVNPPSNTTNNYYNTTPGSSPSIVQYLLGQTPSTSPTSGTGTTSSITPSTTPTTNIGEQETPLASIASGTWSITNLVLALIALVAGIMALFLGNRQRKEYEDFAQNDDDADRAHMARVWSITGFIVAIVLAIIAVVLYVFTQSLFNATMAWFDAYTIPFAIIAILAVIAMRFSMRTYKPQGWTGRGSAYDWGMRMDA